jgi:hypothetical protein
MTSRTSPEDAFRVPPVLPNPCRRSFGPRAQVWRTRGTHRSAPPALKTLVCLLLAFSSIARAGDSSAVSLADLPAYRAALDGKPVGTAVSASFRDLWERPDAFAGKRVRIEARVVRRFHQGKVGTFPPLVESWATTSAGDPLCLVYPSASTQKGDGPGAFVQFEGAYLRRVTYQGGDGERLAPLIVGAAPPVITTPAPPSKDIETNRPAPAVPYDWALGLGAAGLIALALARYHIRKPSRPVLPIDREIGPPPEFLDSE